MRPLLIVDAANVMGSTPDGWWRDRRGAAERLRDRLARATDADLAAAEIVLVVEGKARGVQSIPRVLVRDAPASGDDAIVELVRAAGDRPVSVVTADRGLRERVRALGAGVRGPRSLDLR
jgi:rRNA-processing protein FCF1